MFKVNNKDNRKTPWRRSDVLIVSSKHISHHVLVFLLLILIKKEVWKLPDLLIITEKEEEANGGVLWKRFFTQNTCARVSFLIKLFSC